MHMCLVPVPFFLVMRASQVRYPQSSVIAVEIDGAAIAEGRALIIISKAVLDIGTNRQLVKGLETIKYVCISFVHA
jgi:hypothetical protein